IYIARMKDPWTLDSPRVLISKPEYEWERQWVNPDGSRTAYPIYVNEGPQFFHSKDNKTLILYYAASGSWSPYYCVGMLTADAESDLLDPASWTKSSVPVFQQSLENEVYGPGGLSFVPSPDGTEWYMIYHARQVTNGDTGSPETRNPRIQKIGWDAHGMPDLGIPVRAGVALPKPSGTLLK
ncbi:family 43 glycosylhydrolase, partial [Bacteroides fragilis]